MSDRDVAISVKAVSKRYEVFESQRARLVHALRPSHRAGMREVWALRDVGFEVARGESVAIIGRNGGGKSTLLQILTGVLAPTEGEVAVNGRVCALLELGSGFNPAYTGRDNVILNGLLLGLAREEIVARFEDIAAFAEIGEAMDRPVSTYSSGMLMRLAFAVQVLADPEILIIDEALSVGDFFFQQKCFAHIRKLCESGVTLLFVSHDMGTVRDLCGRAIYLRAGRVEFAGDTRVAIQRYLSERRNGLAAATRFMDAGGPPAQEDEVRAIQRDSSWTAKETESAPGRLIAVALYDELGVATSTFALGSAMRLKVLYRPAPGAPTHVSAVVTNKYNQVVSVLGSSRLRLEPPAVAEDPGHAIFEMRVQLSLEAGNYSIVVALANLVTPNRGENLDSTGPIGPVVVTWDYERDLAPFLGMFGLAAEGSFRRVAPAGKTNH